VQGYVYNRDVLASNFRALFTLQFNQWSKNPKKAENLWPLSMDEIEQLTADEMYARNRNIIASIEASGSMN